MPEITLDAIDHDGKSVPLLSEDAKARYRVQAEDLRREAQALHEQAKTAKGEALKTGFAVDAVKRELEAARIDQRLAEEADARERHADSVRTLRFTVREATVEDADALDDLAATSATLGKLYRKAYELLQPKQADGSAVPRRLYPAVAEACYREIYPDLDSELRGLSRG